MVLIKVELEAGNSPPMKSQTQIFQELSTLMKSKLLSEIPNPNKETMMFKRKTHWETSKLWTLLIQMLPLLEKLPKKLMKKVEKEDKPKLLKKEVFQVMRRKSVEKERLDQENGLKELMNILNKPTKDIKINMPAIENSNSKSNDSEYLNRYSANKTDHCPAVCKVQNQFLIKEQK